MTIDLTGLDEQVLDQASAWIARLSADHVTDNDKQEFALWLAESENHRRAFDEILLLWQNMGGEKSSAQDATAGILQATLTNAYIPASNDEDKNHSREVVPTGRGLRRTDHGQPPTENSEVKNERIINRPFISVENWFVAAAACFAVVAVLLFTNFYKPNGDLDNSYHSTFQSGRGEQLEFSLPDGSIIELNTDSKVVVSYSDEQRHVTLEAGEAYFQVATNPRLTFIVDAGAGRIAALGTAFNIHRQGRNTMVSVTEGTVKVTDTLNVSAVASNTSAPSKHKEVVLKEGQAIKVDASSGLGAVTNIDEALVTAWRQQTLIFDQTNLVNALAELNRYLSVPIDFSDPSLADPDLKISGTFSLKEPETTLTAIINSFSLRVERNTESDQIKLVHVQ